jgi:hypothetical protein
MSFVSSVESQQYPASRPVFFAMGTDFGRFLTFARSVFSIVGGGLLCTRIIGGEVGAGTAMRVVDGTEEGPGTGWTFSRSVFGIVGGGPLCTCMIGGEVGGGAAMRVVDGTEEGPGMGWEYDTESVGVGKRRKLVMR